MMKNLLLALFISAPAFATTTGTLFMKGTVPAYLDIAVTPTSLAATLPLQTSQVNAHVANIAMKWNTINGAKVVVSSANGGQLRHTTVTSSAINYTLHSPAVGSFSVATPQTFNAAVGGPQSQNHQLNISYTGVPHDLLIEGDYTDTVTFTISAL